jgi:hypothetical protein
MGANHCLFPRDISISPKRWLDRAWFAKAYDAAPNMAQRDAASSSRAESGATHPVAKIASIISRADEAPAAHEITQVAEDRQNEAKSA